MKTAKNFIITDVPFRNTSMTINKRIKSVRASTQHIDYRRNEGRRLLNPHFNTYNESNNCKRVQTANCSSINFVWEKKSLLGYLQYENKVIKDKIQKYEEFQKRK